ncbi:PIN domain-containing protein [Ruania suaedae]|uniref:PIN domain-containing protein n=1 Tax=Ruania suaedae TaxID=2897774 RepID=UPI001E2A90EE|nr:PIN domain-containing protein [Ruania suaedae]UFU01873.1 PIN domain-containing protein [Ruania suaedae]
MFAALLDTCTLWPSLRRDLLLSLSVEDLYRPLWSSAILTELERAERIKREERGTDPEKARVAAEHLVVTMASAFDDACVRDWEPLDGTFDLPDSNDEHVLAAAVTGKADVIVTENLKHFPRAQVPRHIEIQTPADFAAHTVSVNPQRAGEAVTRMLARYTNPPVSPERFLDLIVERYRMSETAERLRGVIVPGNDCE